MGRLDFLPPVQDSVLVMANEIKPLSTPGPQPGPDVERTPSLTGATPKRKRGRPPGQGRKPGTVHAKPIAPVGTGPDPRKLARVEDLLKNMTSLSEIRQVCASEFGCQESTVASYIALVYAKWRSIAEEHAPAARDQMREAFVRFYERAMAPDATEKGPDYKAALQALDRIARVDGVYEPSKLNIETTGMSGFKGASDVEARIKALMGNPAIAAKLESMGVGLKPTREPKVDKPAPVSQGEQDGTSEPSGES